jgi:hypothetical protein
LSRSVVVMARGLLPSALAIQMFSDPFLSLMNTRCVPSGDQAGCMS